MKAVHTLALILVIVGALNWGLIGIFDFNLVDALLGEMSALSRIVYTLVGLSAFAVIATSLAPQMATQKSAVHN